MMVMMKIFKISTIILIILVIVQKKKIIVLIKVLIIVLIILLLIIVIIIRRGGCEKSVCGKAVLCSPHNQVSPHFPFSDFLIFSLFNFSGALWHHL